MPTSIRATKGFYRGINVAMQMYILRKAKMMGMVRFPAVPEGPIPLAKDSAPPAPL